MASVIYHLINSVAKMWTFLLICVWLISGAASNISPNYFCADMTPQPHVNIEQLMGMWYGIEIISHNIEEEHYVRTVPSCPILHLSEDKSSSNGYYGNLHRDYNYGYNYGERRGDYDRRGYDRQYERTESPYQRQSNYNRGSSNYNNQRKYTTNTYMRQQPDEMRRLRIWWDENGTGTEYQLRYNTSRPGFWVSSGPQNGKNPSPPIDDLIDETSPPGSELEPQFSHFAGTVQVIKAVGNHLVLTFCHQLPDRELSTILLSRENRLEYTDIHGVHSLLNRKGLSTTNIKKVCNSGASMVKLDFHGFLILLITTYFFSK